MAVTKESAVFIGKNFQNNQNSTVNTADLTLKQMFDISEVTAKSKPMMNLVSRCSKRNVNVLGSAASESPGETRHGSQLPLSLQTEKYDRTERPVVYAHSSSCSEWNVDKTWSSQQWKSDEVLEVRTGRRVNEQPPAFVRTAHGQIHC